MANWSSRDELRSIAASLRHHLERREKAGIPYLPVGESRKDNQKAVSQPVPNQALEGNLFSDYTSAYSSKNLTELRTAIGDCQRCKLAPGRTHLVFGVGNPKAKVMFVGEGPGRDEDLQGEPFVGRAGQLLTDIITKGMGMKREDVYIANVIKCRPPENRNPEPDEIEACEPFLVQQIQLIKPRVIVALGKFAVQSLLKSKVPIMKMRGGWQDYHGTKLMPTLHPAYLLRNPGDKKLVWEDIKKVLQEIAAPAL
ncbi:MAG: uracil-DNA glycosylase [Deltaproteobacteria bacterium]|nr:uracil-DNA glycosylase [Deltaproteobacteria bacterium]